MRKVNAVIRALFVPFGFLPEVILFGSAVYLLVRFTVRDTIVAARYVFYLPMPVFVAACFVGIVFRLAQRRRMWAALVTAAALAALLFCVWTDEFRPGGSVAATDIEGASLKVVTWNIHAGRAGWEKIAGRIRQEDPDIVMLVEAYISRSPDRAGVWAKEFPGYEVANERGPMTILVKGRVRMTKGAEIRVAPFYLSRYLSVEVEVDGRPLNLILIHPTPAFDRDSGEIYGKLVELIDRVGDEKPLILSGDFNTPPNSAYLAPVRERLRSAFEIAGRGFAYSWPAYLPMFAIDHTFVNRHIQVTDYCIEHTNLSDHCIQIMEISLR